MRAMQYSTVLAASHTKLLFCRVYVGTACNCEAYSDSTWSAWAFWPCLRHAGPSSQRRMGLVNSFSVLPFCIECHALFLIMVPSLLWNLRVQVDMHSTELRAVHGVLWRWLMKMIFCVFSGVDVDVWTFHSDWDFDFLFIRTCSRTCAKDHFWILGLRGIPNGVGSLVWLCSLPLDFWFCWILNLRCSRVRNMWWSWKLTVALRSLILFVWP